ncbi:unnamed protein product [Tilletia controversa]|nr:hypothetical protein CF328_g5557 [Tilletia controversa]CAD6978518.1 unnamed protein product [Tilletia controversa]
MSPRSIAALFFLLALASALPLQDVRLCSTDGFLVGGGSDKLDNAPSTPKLPPIALPPIGNAGHAPLASGLPPIGEGANRPKHALQTPKLPPSYLLRSARVITLPSHLSFL